MSDPKEQAAQDKTPMQLLPPEFMEYTAMALEEGAKKYGPFNWREGEPIKLMTYLGAILRHTSCLLSGQWWDKESKLPHVAHIAATCAILIDAWRWDQLDDNTTQCAVLKQSDTTKHELG
jgi:hypothetical protein